MEIRTRHEQLKFQGLMEKSVEELQGEVSFNGLVLL